MIRKISTTRNTLASRYIKIYASDASRNSDKTMNRVKMRRTLCHNSWTVLLVDGSLRSGLEVPSSPGRVEEGSNIS